MDDKIAAFTIFTFLLFTVSAARFTVYPPATNPSSVSEDAFKLAKTSRESLPSASSNIILPSEKAKPDSDETTANNPLPEPDKSQKTKNDSTQRTNFSRFHPINRHFRVKPPIGAHRRPYRKYVTVTQSMVPRTEVSERNNEVRSRVTVNSKPETFPGEVPTNWLKVKHHYSSRRHHNEPRENNENVVKTKNVFDREKLKSLIRQHKLKKKREEEAMLMKNIRKFLKHTFD